MREGTHFVDHVERLFGTGGLKEALREKIRELRAAATQNSLSEDLGRWCRERLRESFETDIAIERTARVPARISRLWSLELRSRISDSKRLYLKQHPSPDAAFDGLFLFARVCDAARRWGDIRIPRLIGLDPQRGLLLMTECPGTPLNTVYRTLILRSFFDPGPAIKIWAGVGAFLKTLHSSLLPPQMSLTHILELCAYTVERIELWKRLDCRHEELARSATAAVEILGRELDGKPVPLVPCHRDVTPPNIIIGETIRMVDFDDLQLDLATVDISQVLLAIEEFCRPGGVVWLKRFTEQLQRSFLRRYGLLSPSGPQFWLSHLRNLSVYALTLARLKPSFLSPSMLRYGRLIDELRRTVQTVQESKGAAPYWRSA